MRGLSGRGAGRGRTGASTASGPGLDDNWSSWWSRNREGFLSSARLTQYARGPTTAGGREQPGHRLTRPPDNAPTRGLIYTSIVPELLSILQQSDEPSVLRAAALALGRVVSAPFDAPAAEALLPLLSHRDETVQRAATVALGLLGTDAGLDPLLDLATCSQQGHRLCGRNPVPDALRASATLGLGLMGRPDAVPNLMDLADRLPDKDAALRASAILAVGLMDATAAEQALPWLTTRCEDRRLPLGVQVSFATSLGRLAPDGSSATLIELLDDPDADHATLGAAVAGLGAGAQPGDRNALDTLLELASDSHHAGMRQLAWLGLADAAVGCTDLAAQQAVVKLLTHELKRPRRRVDRPWIALATGVLVHGRPELFKSFSTPLRKAYEDASDPGQRGAFALALGLAGVDKAGEELLDDLRSTHNESLIGALAQALGMLGNRKHTDALIAAATRKGVSARLRSDVARGLRLLDAERGVKELLKSYAQATNGRERVGLELALGELRQAAAAPALLAACRDKRDVSSRAAACQALGLLAEKDHVPFTARLTRRDNPGYAFDAVESLLASL